MNVYSAEGSIEIEAQKIYSGGSLTTGLFGFELYDSDGNLIASTTNNSNGTIYFDEISYVTPGTYNYTLKELVGSIENVNYDLEEKPITVTVTDSGNGTNIILSLIFVGVLLETAYALSKRKLK